MRFIQLLNGVKGRNVVGHKRKYAEGLHYENLYFHKKKAIESAKNLLYKADVIERLEEAESIEEVDRILATARKKKIQEEDAIRDAEIMKQIRESKRRKK